MKARIALGSVLTAYWFSLGASHLTAQQLVGFGESPSYDIVVPAFTDREVTRLVTTLDARLSTEQDPAKWESDATTLRDFTRRLQAGRLSSTQEARVLQHLGELSRTHPAEAPLLEKSRYLVSALTVGKAAPEITGKDLDGVDLRLSDYRGRVVLLVFSGDWCGICRSEYPYERLLLELYKNWPFAIVGVDSDGDRDAAKKAGVEHGLTYRSWWDGGGANSDSEDGPIASAWGVVGWPTVYLLDAQGVIRFVDLRQENLLKGVHQLLTEQAQHNLKPNSGR
jgi:peroxiredoxin